MLMAVAIALSSVPAAMAKINENAEIEQIANGIVASAKAVACQLRTSEWRNSVGLGYFATARVGVMSEHPRFSDDEIDAKASKIFEAAKIHAALHAEFAAPTQTQCDTLSASHDMEEMDAAAKIGLIVGTVNKQ
jgi:hypothetical protein